jgi:ribose-phosphate pyrophosphokinase
LNKVVEIDVYQFIKKAQFSVFAIEQCFPCIFFPDKGAMERYNSMEDLLCIYGEKTRDWKTGIINGVEIKGVVDENKIKNLPILIVDDICSKGGTFYHSALELKRYGFKNIYLYVTHCEPSIFTGDLYRNRKELCKMVFTTNSIINVSSDWIKIL